MRFQAEHHFAAPVAAVIDLLGDPDFHRDLKLPDLALPEVLVAEDDGDKVRLGLRYYYTGSVDPMVKRFLGSGDLTWRQDLELDRAAQTAELRFAADFDPRKMHGKASIVFEATDDGSRRRLQGELVVSIPVVGGMAERAIVPGVKERLDIEAQALDEQLRTR
jgi:uncharacterized protein DUF2505